MRHVVIVGGGGALAQYLIKTLQGDDPRHGPKITAVCRRTFPDAPGCAFEGEVLLTAVTDCAAVSGPVDVLVTMPGWEGPPARLEDLRDVDWREVLEANLLPVASAFTVLLPKVRNGGNVVVVGSVVGRTGAYGCGPYAAAKAGLVGLVRTAALEHAARGVCVNLLELGHVNCGMGARLAPKVRERALAAIPLRRFAEPAEAVEAIVWLGRVRFMTGGVFPLTGGL